MVPGKPNAGSPPAPCIPGPARRKAYAAGVGRALALAGASAALCAAAPPARVAYLGMAGRTEFHAALPLSDGSLLVGGAADGFAWVPPGTPVDDLSAGPIHSRAPSGWSGLLVQFSPGLDSIRRVVRIPGVRSIDRIRASSSPRTTTGAIIVSGERAVEAPRDAGYFIARLDRNFVEAPPSAFSWTFDVACPPRAAGGGSAPSHYTALQPWDVDADGGVVYAAGSEFDTTWAELGRLDPLGRREIVPWWPAHRTASGALWYGAPATAAPPTDPPVHSAIVLKAGHPGSLRSTTWSDFDVRLPDGNLLNDRKGRFPDDAFFAGPCRIDSCPGGPGYTGFRTTTKATYRPGGIAIDRRTGHVHVGYSVHVLRPSGTYGAAPAVAAFDAQGRLLWWSRLHDQLAPWTDSTGSVHHPPEPPELLVDGVEVDHSAPPGEAALLVLARAKGSNAVSLWPGNRLANSPRFDSAAGRTIGYDAFQNTFTGSAGAIHVQWLGRLRLRDGAALHATYIAEYPDSARGLGSPYAEPQLAGWPSHNAGWPDLASTRCSPEIRADSLGNAYVACRGLRTVTTENGYQRMAKFGEGTPCWNQFVRVFRKDLSTLLYSSLLTGDWDRGSGAGGDNTEIRIVEPWSAGLLAVGTHLDSAGIPRGTPIPTSSIPPWGRATPPGRSALIARLPFEQQASSSISGRSPRPASPTIVRTADGAWRATWTGEAAAWSVWTVDGRMLASSTGAVAEWSWTGSRSSRLLVLRASARRGSASLILPAIE